MTCRYCERPSLSAPRITCGAPECLKKSIADKRRRYAERHRKQARPVARVRIGEPATVGSQNTRTNGDDAEYMRLRAFMHPCAFKGCCSVIPSGEKWCKVHRMEDIAA